MTLQEIKEILNAQVIVAPQDPRWNSRWPADAT